AVQKDPNYAMAYAGLAELYYVLPDNAPVAASEAMPKARAAAEKALALDGTLAQPHAVLGGVYGISFDWVSAEREFRRAIELNPNEGDTRHWYAYLLISLGRSQDAIAQAKQATDLEPLNLKYLDSLAGMYDWSGQYDQAIERYKKNLEMDANYQSSVYNLATTYRATHQYVLRLQ